MSNPQSEPRLKDRQNPSHNDRENSTLRGVGWGGMNKAPGAGMGVTGADARSPSLQE